MRRAAVEWVLSSSGNISNFFQSFVRLFLQLYTNTAQRLNTFKVLLIQVNLKLLVVDVMDFSIANDLFLVLRFILYNDFAFHRVSSNKLFIVYCLFKIILHVYN